MNAKTNAIKLRVPQARVLQALMPRDIRTPIDDWPTLTRATMAHRAGYTEKSGSITRALLGIREGSSSGDPHLGLQQLGMVETIDINVDGVIETNYKITIAGLKAIVAFLASGNVLPEVRDASVHTNERYRKD